MATVKGVWVFNDHPTIENTNFIENVNFTSDGDNCTAIKVSYYSDGSGSMRYEGASSQPQYKFKSKSWLVGDEYKTVDFGETEQTVSDDFYTWLTENATSQSVEEPEDTLYGVYASELTAVADAIRSKTGKTASLTLEQMVTEIEGIEVDGGDRIEFPAIPADVLAEYPYAWCSVTASGSKWGMFSNAPWYEIRSGLQSDGNIRWYKVIDGAWTLHEADINMAFPLATYPIAWANHDIRDGSETATKIYFAASPILV